MVLLDIVPVLDLSALQSFIFGLRNFRVRRLYGVFRDNDIGLQLRILHAANEDTESERLKVRQARLQPARRGLRR